MNLMPRISAVALSISLLIGAAIRSEAKTSSKGTADPAYSANGSAGGNTYSDSDGLNGHAETNTQTYNGAAQPPRDIDSGGVYDTKRPGTLGRSNTGASGSMNQHTAAPGTPKRAADPDATGTSEVGTSGASGINSGGKASGTTGTGSGTGTGSSSGMGTGAGGTGTGSSTGSGAAGGGR